MAKEEALVMDMIFGRWRSQILYTGVKLGVFDVLGKAPISADAVAEKLGLDSALGYRLLRALGCLELLVEDRNRSFTLSPAGEHLKSDHPQTLRGVALLKTVSHSTLNDPGFRSGRSTGLL